jgi:peptidoglycan/LPS O-acetylase OafA/YrhL
MLAYRREIDGLRALAVLPVLFSHAGLPGFGGGFVGVDIFFVISGFLITSILINELNQNKYSVINFYERRARRLLPAFGGMLIFSTVLGLMFLPPEALKVYGQSMFASVGVAANIFFQLELDYFSAAAEDMPLLHIWSLSIEEQFYIIFPILFAAIFSKGKWAQILLISGLVLISFATMMWALGNENFNFAFYNVTTRAWELLAGSLIAFLPYNKIKNPLLKSVGSLIGVAILLASISFISAKPYYPNAHAIWPVVGTCLFLIFADKNNIVGKVFSWRPLVWIGLISYSLYLYHQPIFAIARTYTVGTPPASVFVSLIGISIALAYLSYKYIEQPFKNKTNWPRRRIFKTSIVFMSIAATVALTLHFTDGLPQRYGDTFLVVEKDTQRSCITKGRDALPAGSKQCTYNPEKSSAIMLLGDSHGNQIAQRLKHTFTEKWIIHATFSGCPPALTFNTNNPGCSEWTQQAVDYAIQNDSIEDVILVYRHSFYVFGEQAHHYPNVPTKPSTDVVKDTQNIKEDYMASFLEMVRQLKGAGKRVYVLSPTPELPDDIMHLVKPHSVFSSEPRINLDMATTRDYQQRRHGWFSDYAQQLISMGGIYIDTYPILCDFDGCPAIWDGKVGYFDGDHLTSLPAQKITDALLKKYNEHVILFSSKK